MSPSGIRPPFLHAVDVRVVKLVLMVHGRHWDGENEQFLDRQSYRFEGKSLLWDCPQGGFGE